MHHFINPDKVFLGELYAYALSIDSLMPIVRSNGLKKFMHPHKYFAWILEYVVVSVTWCRAYYAVMQGLYTVMILQHLMQGQYTVMQYWSYSTWCRGGAVLILQHLMQGLLYSDAVLILQHLMQGLLYGDAVLILQHLQL